MSEWISKFSTWVEKFKVLLENDFDRGLFYGVAGVLAVVLFLLIIRLLLAFFFRRKRCSSMVVSGKDGDIVIAGSAVENAIHSVVSTIPAVQLIRVRIFRIKKKYQLHLFCSYDGSAGTLPEMSGKVKVKLSDMFVNFFGVNNISKINIELESLTGVKLAPVEIPKITLSPRPETEKGPLDEAKEEQ